MPAAGTGTPVDLPQRLSPSRLSDFKQCPAKFYYGSVVKLPRPASVATTVGTLAHTAFEKIFDHPREDRTFEVAVTYVEPEWENLKNRDSYAHLVDQEEEILRLARESVEGWFSVERPHNFDPVGREMRLLGEVSGVPLLGIIDRVDRIESQNGEKVYISDYKGLALDTPLPTPSGWTTMREVREGEYLIGADGAKTKVLEKSPVSLRDCYEIEFADGSVVVCDEVHLWGVVTDGAYMVLDARELEAVFKGSTLKLTMPRRSALVGEHDSTLSVEAAARWLSAGEGSRENADKALRADEVQRRAVLTRMEFSKEDSEGTLVLDGLDQERAEVFLELLATFSFPAEMAETEGGCEVAFDPSNRQWEIVDVRKTASVETACVKVENRTGLYLAGRAMIPTHNTGKVPAIDDRFLEEKFFAMRMYALLWHTLHDEVPHELRLIYVKGASRDAVRKLKVDGTLVENARKELKSIYAGMKKAAKSGQFECKKQPLCQWCDFMEICPAWHPELEGLTVGEIRRKVINGQDTLFDAVDG